MTQEKPFEFQEGDIVEWCGAVGVVLDAGIGLGTVMCVDFYGSPQRIVFHTDGKYCSWHKEPSLKLISRPTQHKPIEIEVEVYDNGCIQPVGNLKKSSCLNPEHHSMVRGEKVRTVKLVEEKK